MTLKKTFNHGEHGGHGEKLEFQVFLRAYPAGD